MGLIEARTHRRASAHGGLPEHVERDGVLSGRDPRRDRARPVERRIHRAELACDTDDVARHLAGESGRDRAAPPPRAGLGQRLGVPPRLFVAEPRDPHSRLADRRRGGLASGGASERGRGQTRGRGDLHRLRFLYADPRPARPRTGGDAPRPDGPAVGFARRLHQLHPPRGVAALPGLCDAPEPQAANIRRHRDNVLRRSQPAQAPGLFSPGSVQPRQPDGYVRAHSGRGRFDLRRRVAGAPRIGGKVLRGHPRDHFSHRREIDLRRDPGARLSQMSVARKSSPIRGQARAARQVPSFAVIGVIGYFVDSAITYLGAKYLGLSPELARPPGFIVATMVNFLLNRAITFRGSGAPVMRAFVRYCLVASAGLAVNYAVYSVCVVLAPRFGVGVTPAILPLFVAAGVGVSMILTFVGFRFFAFRP